MTELIDLRRYHDVTRRFAVFSTSGGAHRRGDTDDLQLRDGNPILSAGEQERARLGGALVMYGSRPSGDGASSTFGSVFEGAATVIVTTHRLIVMAVRGSGPLGTVPPDEVHTFVLPWDLVDSIQIPVKKSMEDRITGNRTIRITSTVSMIALGLTPADDVMVDQRQLAWSDDDVMAFLVRTAAEHRLSVSPASEVSRLRAVLAGPYETEDGVCRAWISPADGFGVPAHLVGRLVETDAESGSDAEVDSGVETDVGAGAGAVHASGRVDGVMDGRSVVITFDVARELLVIEDRGGGNPATSVVIDRQTLPFQFEARSIRSGRWVVDVDDGHDVPARQLVDAVNRVILAEPPAPPTRPPETVPVAGPAPIPVPPSDGHDPRSPEQNAGQGMGVVLKVIGFIVCIAMVVKFSIIGYYDHELPTLWSSPPLESVSSTSAAGSTRSHSRRETSIDSTELTHDPDQQSPIQRRAVEPSDGVAIGGRSHGVGAGLVAGDHVAVR